MRRLFTLTWWRYVLNDRFADSEYGTYLSRCWCRAHGHPEGVFFYNVGGTEPDYRCMGCGEDLG